MNKWVERAVFLNILLLLTYVFVDYFLWVGIASKLQPIHSNPIQAIRMIGEYGVLSHILTIQGWFYVSSGSSLIETFDNTSSTPNLQLLFFIITIIVNMILVYKAAKPS